MLTCGQCGRFVPYPCPHCEGADGGLAPNIFTSRPSSSRSRQHLVIGPRHSSTPFLASRSSCSTWSSAAAPRTTTTGETHPSGTGTPQPSASGTRLPKLPVKRPAAQLKRANQTEDEAPSIDECDETHHEVLPSASPREHSDEARSVFEDQMDESPLVDEAQSLELPIPSPRDDGDEVEGQSQPRKSMRILAAKKKAADEEEERQNQISSEVQETRSRKTKKRRAPSSKAKPRKKCCKEAVKLAIKKILIKLYLQEKSTEQLQAQFEAFKSQHVACSVAMSETRRSETRLEPKTRRHPSP